MINLNDVPLIKAKSIEENNAITSLVVRQLKEFGPNTFLMFNDQKVAYYLSRVYTYNKSKPSELFQREAILDKVSHANVLSPKFLEPLIYDFDHFDGAVSYALYELPTHGSVWDMFSQGKFPRADSVLVRTLFHQILNGLEHLHSKGIYHLNLCL
mmetsp:Transcript_4781/g.3976  ORF Transcript_4781/g.3976 Transcript_4781/m.3976 type:complete len:155 (+) Transcript_4781:117-581(+)